MNSPRIKSFRSKLKLKIDTKLTAFKSSSSSRAHSPSKLSAISESKCEKYNKHKNKKRHSSKLRNNERNERNNTDSNEHKQESVASSPFNYNHRNYNINCNDPSTPTPYNSPYNPSTPRSQERPTTARGYNDLPISPCIGYDTPYGNDRDNGYPLYDNTGDSMECEENEEDNIASPVTPVTPKTPITPHSYRDRQRRIKARNKIKNFSLKESEQEMATNVNGYDVKYVLRKNGYSSVSKLATTLQGVIFKGKISDGYNKRIPQNDNKASSNSSSKESTKSSSVVIKVTEKRWHEKSVAYVDGKEIPIEENIVDETKILRWLTHHNPPPAMTRFVDFFQDEKNLFLVMEDGGMDFFKFVAECHKLINSGLLSVHEWQCATKVLFRQMIEFMDWMHTKMGVCHLDISLENLLISDVFVMSDTMNGQQQIYLSHNFQIRFCDFGLATAFDGKDFRCDKYVGKTGYKAPKVYGKKKVFDARLADIWSLGIVLFMMTIGAPPFKRPSKKEFGYELVITGRMDELLESWTRMNYLTPPMFDLLSRMLSKEEKRITMKEIKRHPWVALN